MKKRNFSVVGILFFIISANNFNGTLEVNAYSYNDVYYGMSIDENNSVDFISYEEFHAYDGTSIINKAYVPYNFENILTTSSLEKNLTPVEDYQYEMFPYSAICIVNGFFDTNNDGIADIMRTGTGAIVGPKTILTSSYLIFDQNYNWMTNIEIIPGRYKISDDNEIFPFGKITSLAKATVGTYHLTGSVNDAWALLDLNYDIGSYTGYFGTSYTDISVNSSIKLIGYHGDLNMNMGYGIGNVTYLETYQFRHNCYVSSGTTGAPLMYGMNVVGVHFGQINSSENIAFKVSSYIVGWINERNSE